MHKRYHAEQKLHHEQLESRVVLSGDGVLPSVDIPGTSVVLENPHVNQSETVTVAQPAVITALHLRINGDLLVTVDSAFDAVRLNAGDRIEVLGADYEIHESYSTQQGIFALESYVSKLPLGHGAATPDFSDGRFSVPGTNPEVGVGAGRLAAAQGNWVVEEGWDRLTLAMVHYHGDQADHVASFAAQLQVGDPNFTMDPEILDQLHDRSFFVGDTVPVWGVFMNQGGGRYHNYWEVDVYRDGEATPGWVGVSVGNTSADTPMKAEMLHPADGAWTPEVAGDYVLRFYSDPEDTWRELNEEDNEVELRITIAEKDVVPEPAITVAPEILAKMRQKVDLQISIDTTRFDGVLVTGLPRKGAKIIAGEKLADGSFYIAADRLDGAQFTSNRRIRKGEIEFAPMRGDDVVRELSVKAKVMVEPSADQIRYQRMRTLFRDRIRSLTKNNPNETATLTISGLPDLVKLRGAKQTRDGWVVTDVNKLRLQMQKGQSWKALLQEGLELKVSVESENVKSGRVRVSTQVIQIDHDMIERMSAKAISRLKFVG